MRKFLIVLFVLAIIGGFLSWKYYNDIFDNNISTKIENYELYINSGQNLESVFTQLEKDSVFINSDKFLWVAKLMKYGSREIPSGRYIITSPMSNKSLVTKLRAGWQDPVNVTINNVRDIPALSGKLSKNLELDSVTIINDFEAYIQSNDKVTTATFMCYFIPNTYEMYWNISTKKLLERMNVEYDKYWNNPERQQQLISVGLNPPEVYTLASIVEKETNKKEEKAIIAGVYLNRLKIGIKLQADPTVVFATQNFKLRRVLNKHLKVDSPYNTYKHEGLPPGPICMPSLTTIEAVLNAEKHDYIFFCAEPGYNGKHAFAKNLRGHNNNAIRYRAWLKSEGIR